MFHKWLGITGLLLITSAFTVLAQTEPITTYSASDIAWHFAAPNNYTGDTHQPMNFLNVATDDAGQVYVANFGSVLIFNGESGVLEGAVRDDSGTIVQYDDAAPAGEGNVWVADSKSTTVYL